MRAGKLLAVIGLVVALVAGACGLESSLALTVVGKDFSFSGVPREIRGGTFTMTFRNEGKVNHELAFVNIGGASFQAFRSEFPKIFEGGPFPEFFRDGGVPFEVPPGKSQTSTISLPAGNYLLFCALTGDPTKPRTPEGEEAQGKPHYELGMVIPEVTVRGGGGDLEAPDGEFVAKDYTFDVPQLGAGRHEVVFRNEGPEQWHHMVVMEFPQGVDEQGAINAFRAFGEADATGQPPPPGTPEPEDAGYGGIFSPGNGQTIELELKAGRTYALACFIQDKTGGPPHVAPPHNMLKTFTVR